MAKFKPTPSQEAAMKDVGKSMLVSAAAGSGKTRVLTERIIRSLTRDKNPADLSRLLIVTFTRAAAAELKSRIAEALTEALAENPSNTYLSEQLLKLGSAQISTIDSFFLRIVRSNFDKLGMAASFRSADSDETLPIALEVMDSVIEEFYTRYSKDGEGEISPISRIRANGFASVLNHLMSDRSDGKLSMTLLQYRAKFRSYPEGIGLLRACADELAASASTPFLQTRAGRVIVDYLLPSFEHYANTLETLDREIAENTDHYPKCQALITSDCHYCREMAIALRNADYTRVYELTKAFSKGRFPSITNKPDEVARYQTLRSRMLSTVDRTQEIFAPCEGEIALQTRETEQLCRMLFDFYTVFEARFLAEKQARGILEYDDVRAMLYRLLSSPEGLPSQFSEELASEYDEVYIDEYQDVDLLQDLIFARIGQNRRFMVGDIKQSIYGFRGSDPSIFAAYRRDFPLHTADVQSPDGVCVFMSNNFRCDQPVIDFANRVCAFLFSACEKSVGYREEDDLVFTKEPDDPLFTPAPVQVAVFEAPKRGDTDALKIAEEVWVAAEIAELLRSGKKNDGSRITPSDIAILTQTRAAAEDFIRELEALNVPVISESSKGFLSDPLLCETLNLLRAIDNPYRDVPLSELLLSPICGYTLEELTMLRDSAPSSRALFDALVMRNADKLTEDLAKKASATVEWLDGLRESASVLPADRFLRLLFLDPHLVNYASEPVLLFLYEQARIYQRSSFCGLYGFLGHIDKLIENEKISAQGFVKAESAVTVMTIHHSKGLEFPVVFVSACGASFNRKDLSAPLMFHRNAGCACKLYDTNADNNVSTVLREAAKLEVSAEQTEEAIRTLYVALTRARERLYVTGSLAGKRETALKNAENLLYGDRAAILGCSNYLAWILSSLKEPARKRERYKPELRIFSPYDVCYGTPLEDEAIPTEIAAEGDAKARETANRAAEYAEIRRRAADFRYPLDALRGLPTKAAASKLRPDLLDGLLDGEMDSEAIERQIALMQSGAPDFDAILSDIQKPKATDIGTATHAFLEFCDFSALARDGIDRECERLVSNGFISENAAKIIHREQLEAFVGSDLMEWISKARKVRREQKFSLFIPMAELTRDHALITRLGDTPIFVQGSIDMLLEMPNGELLLVDYKTDRIRDGEREDYEKLRARMQTDHGDQMACYVRAVKQLFGKAPDRSYIYSLPLGRLVEID